MTHGGMPREIMAALVVRRVLLPSSLAPSKEIGLRIGINVRKSTAAGARRANAPTTSSCGRASQAAVRAREQHFERRDLVRDYVCRGFVKGNGAYLI